MPVTLGFSWGVVEKHELGCWTGLSSAALTIADPWWMIIVFSTSEYGNLFIDLDYKFWKLYIFNDFLLTLKELCSISSMTLPKFWAWSNWLRFCLVKWAFMIKKHLKCHFCHPQVPCFLQKKKVGKVKSRHLGKDFRKWLFFSSRLIGDQWSQILQLKSIGSHLCPRL